MKSNFKRVSEIPCYFQVYVHERVLISDSDGFAECAGEVPAEGETEFYIFGYTKSSIFRFELR